MINNTLIVLGLLALLSKADLPLFSRETSNRIFTHHESILLYVSTSHHANFLRIVEQACIEDLQCAKLSPESNYFEQINKFIGYQADPFLAIIDANNQYKYIQIISQDFNTQQVQQFIARFDRKELQPFFASQTLLTQQFWRQDCNKLVGSNYQEFLSQQQPIKIVYLYSSDSVCRNCQQLLYQFTQIAEKHREEGTLLFGYFDVTLNDNRMIRDQIFPYFLIYLYDNFEDPYGVEVEQFQQMETFIEQLKKDVGKVRETANQSVYDEQEYL